MKKIFKLLASFFGYLAVKCTELSGDKPKYAFKFNDQVLEPGKVRLTVTMTSELADQIEVLREDLGCDLTQLVATIFATFATHKQYVSDGGEIILRDNCGNEEKIPASHFTKYGSDE